MNVSAAVMPARLYLPPQVAILEELQKKCIDIDVSRTKISEIMQKTWM